MSFLQDLFHDKLVVDKRLPLISWNLQILTKRISVDFLAPNYIFYIQILTILALQMAVGCVLSLIMYYGIIVGSAPKPGKSVERTNDLQRYLIGYGIVIPVSLYFPFYLLDFLDLRGVGFRMGIVCLPMTVTLRCLESMYGFVDANECNMWKYVVSSGFIVKPVYGKNGDLLPLTIDRFIKELKYHVTWLFVFTIMYHIFEPVGWYPFPSRVVANQIWISFDVGNIYNTFVQATLISMSLAFSVSGCGLLASLLSGVEFNGRITENPMFASTSVSDFWGRRWNNLIHIGLKQGIYKPVRSTTGNRTLASMASFVVSGLYHELVWKILFVPTSKQCMDEMSWFQKENCCQSCYCYGWAGKQLVFFAWNGALIALEYIMGSTFVRLVKPIPLLLRAHFVVLLSLPVGHLFTADLTISGYFESISQALPRIIIHKKTSL